VLEQFGRAGFLLVFALAFPIIPIAVSALLGALKFRPKRPDPVKSATYECGVEAVGHAWGQFNARYYVYALIFVVFDVEVVFLYPWAVAFPELGIAGFVAGALFLLILVVGFVYDWAKKALEWT
jgi:NADH:ubiquinone oxidoreductase subunit 3 (subunit A)